MSTTRVGGHGKEDRAIVTDEDKAKSQNKALNKEHWNGKKERRKSLHGPTTTRLPMEVAECVKKFGTYCIKLSGLVIWIVRRVMRGDHAPVIKPMRWR